MTTKTIYTLGYTGTKPEQIKALADKLGALIVDIRYVPRSRVAFWNQGPLQKILGKRYVWERGFGNEGYKTGTIKLHDPVKATLNLSKLLERQSIILLCACKDVKECHRKPAAEYLAERLGLPMQHLTPADTLGLASTTAEEPAKQGNLF